MSRAKLPTAAFSQSHRSEVTNPKWDKLDITAALAPYSQTTGVFHQLKMGRIGVAVYLLNPANGKVVLEHKPEFHHNTLEVYNMRIGEEAGPHIGYLFRSPLRVKVDPYFVMFLKRGLDPINDVIKHPVSAEKRYVLQDLVFHTHATSYLITRVEDNGVTKMLNQ